MSPQTMDNHPPFPPSHLHGSPSRRRFLQQAVAAGSLGAFASPTLVGAQSQPHPSTSQLPAAFDKLGPLGTRVHPIPPAEFRERIAQAQRLMADPKSQAADSSSTP